MSVLLLTGRGGIQFQSDVGNCSESSTSVSVSVPENRHKLPDSGMP